MPKIEGPNSLPELASRYLQFCLDAGAVVFAGVIRDPELFENISGPNQSNQPPKPPRPNIPIGKVALSGAV